MKRPPRKTGGGPAPAPLPELLFDLDTDGTAGSLPAEPAAGEFASSPLDQHFAALMVRLNGGAHPALAQAAQAVSAWRAAGHVCVPLRRAGIASATLLEDAKRVIGRPGEWKPLILDDADRLYLQRYWQYEQHLAAAIRNRLTAAVPTPDGALLARGLDELFPPAAKNGKRKGTPHGPDDQRTAAEVALTSNFCVVTGGPGTGKTRTIARILALLHAQAVGAAPRIALTAPTGKAAARMTESIQLALTDLPGEAGRQLRAALLGEAVTLHALLGLGPDSSLPRFHAERPLSVDAVIVDEASMVDLAMMAKLFAAVPTQARIILLGDRDQLASVEAGHVLGDICGEAGAPPRRHIIELRRNFRFRDGSGIRALSEAVNSGRADEAVALLTAGAAADVVPTPLPAAADLGRHLRERVVAGFRAAFAAKDDPRAALEALGHFRILCAVRRGPFGVENFNRLAEQALASERLISPLGTHYAFRPVMILRNDYNLRLFNGDVGLILPDAESGGALRACFLASDGALRRLLPSRLPEHETVWAMTVHKSQGSEFDRVLLALPDRDSPVLTRELIYTAITRARSSVEVWFTAPVLRMAIGRRTERTSGLRDALWGTEKGQGSAKPAVD